MTRARIRGQPPLPLTVCDPLTCVPDSYVSVPRGAGGAGILPLHDVPVEKAAGGAPGTGGIRSRRQRGGIRLPPSRRAAPIREGVQLPAANLARRHTVRLRAPFNPTGRWRPEAG